MPDAIDVADFQTIRDWRAVPVALGIAKATEGRTFVARTFAHNWSGIADAGKRRGAYHFCRPDKGNSAIAEADFFCSVALGFPPYVDQRAVYALDLEPFPGVPWPLSRGGTHDWTLTFLERVEAMTGVVPWWYTYPAFVSEHLDHNRLGELARFPLWWADPPPPNAAPFPPALVQYGVAPVPGVGGACDVNVFGPAYDHPPPSKPKPTPPKVEDDMRPFFVKDPDGDTVWFCRDGIRTGVPGVGDHGMAAVKAIALMSNATNGVDRVYNGDGAVNDEARAILAVFREA